MDIQNEEFDFITDVEPNCKTIYDGPDVDYAEGRRSLVETELQLLDLHEGKNCVTVSKLDVEIMLEYFNSLENKE